MARRHLVLVGLMGCGKSTLARRVAHLVDCQVLDLDAQIEARAGCTIPELFATRGEAVFRDLETQMLQHALDATSPSVIATGGGVVVREINRMTLARSDRAMVVWLDTTPEVLAARVAGTAATRPLLAEDPLGALRRLHDERREWYAEVAHRRLDVASGPPEELARRLATWWQAEATVLPDEETP